MIFSALLTLVMVGLMVYGLLLRSQFPLVGNTLPFVCLSGVYVAWFPESTAKLAHLVGVGRGADLMLYLWLLVSGFLFLVLHLKLVTQDRRMTELARSIALAGARPPEPSASPAPGADAG